ncbi:polymeric immunoglobulin receptor-like [Melanotaenia boesemani]|uniref:polymeric immunoglobulin receptor-like n=1 Tax=Melanotaenia boesemani TaxID=1250792 RepID=UPI001C04CA25|nr:polymeric immunoglobulin receptor-like [Melanotaenia boesemani]
MSGIVGRAVTLQCPYPPQHQNNRKFLCKGEKHNSCTDMLSQNRFTLHNVSSSSYLVTIKDLEAGDAGTYWCGSDAQWSVGNYTKIYLSVEWCCVKSTNMSGIVGRAVTLQCPYPPQHQNNRKFLCKGDKHNSCTDMMSQSRFTLHNDVNRSFLVTIKDLEAGDAGTYWCGSDAQWSVGNYTKIHLSVDAVLYVVFYVPGVLLLMLTFVLVIVYKRKCNRDRGNKNQPKTVNPVMALEDTYIEC